MKNHIRHLASVLTVAALVSAVHAAEEKKSAAKEEKPKEEKKELRVISATPGERRVIVSGRTTEKEKVTFLGVETSPVSGVVAAQLGLTKGGGLVVNHIVPDSAAAGALQENDILLRLNDQILIETRQLAVLVRNFKDGEEVTLTFLRGGKETTAKVKLGTKEVPKVSIDWNGARIPLGGGQGFAFAGNGESGFRAFQFPAQGGAAGGGGGIGEHREEIDRVLSLIRPGHDGEPMRIQIDRRDGPGFRAISVNTANSTLSFSDDGGSLEVTSKDGKKSLVAKDAKGAELFAGSVNTPEERKAMPEAVRQRLEKLEGMHDITFHTDADFKGAEAKVLQPAPRGISLPNQEGRERERVRRSGVFF